MPKIIKSQNPPSKSPAKNATLDISAIIAALFDKKEPTWVHLNRIIKRKEGEVKDFPFQEARLLEFHVPGRSKAAFTEDEKALIQLEAKTKEQEKEIRLLRQRLVEVEKASLQKGFKVGFEKGLTAGHDRAKQEMDARIKDLQAQVQCVLETVENQKALLFHQAERILLELVLCCVKKIVGEEILINPEVISRVVQKALRHVTETLHMTILVHPEDAAKVKEELPLWIPLNKALKSTAVEEDARVQKGGCIIMTDAGQIDGRIDTQTEKLAGLIEEIWREKQ